MVITFPIQMGLEPMRNPAVLSSLPCKRYIFLILEVNNLLIGTYRSNTHSNLELQPSGEFVEQKGSTNCIKKMVKTYIGQIGFHRFHRFIGSPFYIVSCK